MPIDEPPGHRGAFASPETMAEYEALRAEFLGGVGGPGLTS